MEVDEDFEDFEEEQDDKYFISKNTLLRNYQLNLIEVASRENSIIYLPTGTGKTLIAIHILCSRSDEIKGKFREGGKRAFFVATTKILGSQLAKTLIVHTKFRVGLFTGDMNVHTWNQEQWVSHFEKYQVIVLTAEILRQILQFGYIGFEEISLIVFDECHNAVSEHPYRSILLSYRDRQCSEGPLILGLSAVLLVSTPKSNRVAEMLQSLEYAFDGKIVTDDHLEEILSFAANPKEELVLYDSITQPAFLEKIVKIFDDVIDNSKEMDLNSYSGIIPDDGKDFKDRNKAKFIKNCFINCKSHLDELGAFGGSISALFYILLIEKIRLLTTDDDFSHSLVYGRTELYKIRRALLKEMGEESASTIWEFSSPKVREIINLIAEIMRNFEKKNYNILIFVHQRATAIVLSYIFKRLNAVDPKFKDIKPEFVVGNSIFAKETIFFKYSNEEIVKKFSSYFFNLLVATNILEEGIDITSCNYVINFDFPLGYASYFQSRGRARDKSSTHYIFVPREELTEKVNQLKRYSDIVSELHKLLLEKENTEMEIENPDVEPIEKLTFPGENGMITIDSTMAIKVVYNYCSSLPQDKFACLAPTAWYKMENSLKRGYIQLPMSSCLREVIEGEVRGKIKSAKKNAFLKAVQRLYELGELDCDFKKKGVEASKNWEHLFPHFKKEPVDNFMPQPGSKKRKQTYKVEFAESLSNCLPLPGVKAYLHVINFTVAFDKPELRRKAVLYDLLRTPTTYAILSSKKLTEICQFPLFLDMGKITCDILVNYDEVVLTEPELNNIKLCHFAIFKKVIRTLSNFQVFDNRNKENSFFVVPIRKDSEERFVLNWDVINSDFCQNNGTALVRYNPSTGRCDESKGAHTVLDNEASNALVPMGGIDGRLLWGIRQGEGEKMPRFTMKEEADYKFFVISPNYRKLELPKFYVVDGFCHDMSPLSEFPRASYGDYFSYYKEKYEIEITNPEQPLLRVSVVFNCSNFNLPRDGFGGRGRKFKEKFREYEELLVPELCDVFPFDRNYWLKALLLPTVLNRVTQLYHVDEFRRKIVRETGLGLLEPPAGGVWKPMEVDLKHCEAETPEETAFSRELNSSLPVSQLKDKAKKNNKVVMDPERNLYEIGVCDLEHFVSLLQDVDPEKEFSACNSTESNFEILRLMNLHSIQPPVLNIFKEPESQLGPELAEFFQACTSKSTNDIFDYERLEVFGDSFLKFSTTLYLFRTFPDNEGILTSVKGKLLGNRNLMYCGLAKNLQSVINVTEFVPSSEWNPPLFCVPERLMDGIIADNVDPAVVYRFEIPSEEQFSGDLSESTYEKNEELLQDFDKVFQLQTTSLLPYNTIGDKIISDCVESLLGAYLKSLGIPSGLKFLMWLEILPKDGASYEDLVAKPYDVQLLGPGGEGAVLKLLSQVFYPELESTIGYNFKNKALLLEALTHPSYTVNRITNCYQRFEFLGDAILDFLITSYIYENCGNLKPGDVTDIRSALVNNVTFGCLVVRYELHKYLLSCSAPLSSAIANFVQFQTSRNHAVDENVMFLLEEKDCMIAGSVQVPKALGDLFESIAAAIFLDSGNSLETVWRVYYKMMKLEIDEFTKNAPKTSVRLLYEICGEPPYFATKVVDKDLVKVMCTAYYDNHEIKTSGFGPNKYEGKKSAAKLAVKKILELKK